jgi:hypothetical protein
MCSCGGSRPPIPCGPTKKPGDAVAGCASDDQVCPGKDNKELQTALDEQAKMLKAKKAELGKWDDDAKKKFEKWFGKSDDESKKKIQSTIEKMIELNKKTTTANLKKAEPEEQDDDTFAYLYPDDKTHTIYIDKAFCGASNTGKDSRAGTLCHEMSHFQDIGGMLDHQYPVADCKSLAEDDPDLALENANNFEYYLENVD